jgi:hypothetical protein
MTEAAGEALDRQVRVAAFEFLAIVPRPAPDDASADAGSQSARRLNWALLLRRVFAIQVLVCERCGGARRILGAVTEPHAVRRLLAALGLAAEPPPGRPVPAA